jgi:hypothetical protein
MTKCGRLFSTGITHTAALLIGWGGWTAIRHVAGTAEPAPAISTKARGRQTDGAKSVDQILAIISPNEKGRENLEEEWKARTDQYTADFNELVRTMDVPDDPKAAVEAEMKLGDKGEAFQSAKLAALLYFWSKKDFSGLLKWADRNDEAKTSALANHMQKIVETTIEEKGAKAIFGMPKDENWSNNLMYFAGCIVGKSGDPGQLAGAREALDPRQWRNFMATVAGNWPWDGKSKLVELAISENEPGMISRLARSHDADAVEASTWLLEVMNDETLDAGFREKFAKDPGMKSLANSDSKMPVATRIALLQGGSTEAQPDQGLFDRLATNDVKNALRGGQDWNFAFRHGAMEADEVLAAASAQFPEQAAMAPDAVRNALFETLAEQDSGRAMALLKDLSPVARTRAVLDAATEAFFQVDPNRFLGTLQHVPADDPDLWDARLDAWVKHGPDNYRRLDAGYVDWVRALPEGVDRDMALYSLAMASQESNPPLAAELRDEVKSEELKQRIGRAQ